MSEKEFLTQWRQQMGMAASHLLTIAWGGHPMDEITGKVLTEVRDHLSGEIGKIAETKLKASQPVEAPKKVKRK